MTRGSERGMGGLCGASEPAGSGSRQCMSAVAVDHGGLGRVELNAPP